MMRQSVTDVNPRLTRFESSCFDGHYVAGNITPEFLDRIERQRGDAQAGGEDEPGRNQLNLQLSAAQD